MRDRKKKIKWNRELVLSVLIAYGLLSFVDHTGQLWKNNLMSRILSKNLGKGKCQWTPPGKHNQTIITKGLRKNTEMTVIAGYPGSGKRFVWGLVESLAGSQIGDDWDISRKGMSNIAIKTGFPHPKGIWSWDRQGNHAILIIRNPMDTFKDYHNIVCEIWPAGNRDEIWAMGRDYKVYTKNWDTANWENWRDSMITRTIDLYGWYIDFWMNNGFRRNDGKGNPFYDPRCIYWMDTCVPKEIISFEKLYDPQRADPEVVKLMNIFKQSKGIVPIIDQSAYKCVRGKFQEKKSLHNARRYGTGPENFEKTYNHTQLGLMIDELIRLRDKYSHVNYTNVTVAPTLVENMIEYIQMTEIEWIKAFALYEGWVMMSGHGIMNYTRSQPGLWGSIDKGSYVRRICVSCENDTHKDIYYKRHTHPGNINYTHLFEEHWQFNPTGGSNNFGVDFSLHSTFNDAQINTNPWLYCDSAPAAVHATGNFTSKNYSWIYYHYDNFTRNYSDFNNISSIGFPYQCGPQVPILNNWNSLNNGEGQQDYALFTSLYPEGWTMLYGNGALDVGKQQPDNLHDELWEAIDKGSYIRRICSSCTERSHQNIIYKRLTPKGTIDFKKLFLENWVQFPSGGSNVFGTDFALFSNFDDAQNDANFWKFCNFDENSVGFPRHCGPNNTVLDEWNSIINTKSSEDDYAFYIYTGTSVNLQGWYVLNSRGSMASPYTQDALWDTIDSGAVVRRLCASCTDTSHKDIIIKRKTSKGGIDMRNLFLENWSNDPANGTNNQIGVDFSLYSTVLDADNDMNAWSYCDYNNASVGFPNSCGGKSAVPSNWNSITGGGQHAFCYYISKEYDGWAMISSNGTLSSSDAMPGLWGAIDEGSYVKRVCSSCRNKSHRNIIYKRLRSREGIDMETLFLEKWWARPPGSSQLGYNIKGTDFNLFSNMGDAESNQNMWSYCNYNDHYVGFPRDCGPSGRTNLEWNSNIKYGGQEDYAFYMAIKQENYVMLDGFGEMFSVDTWPNLWRTIEEGSFIRRICASCTERSHQNIVYRRLTPPDSLDFRSLFLQDWVSDLSPTLTNTMNVDFSLYNHLSDAKRNVNRWTFCNYNIAGVGFPRECGPTEPVNDEWNSVMINGGETDYAYYLSLDIDGWFMLAGHGVMSSKNTQDQLWSAIDEGSYVKRVCASCINESHRSIVYRRYSSTAGLDAKKLFEQSWEHDPNNGINNAHGTDFNLFSTYKNARNNADPWGYCNYNAERGFPNECGVTSSVASDWNSVTNDNGQPHYAFYLSKYMDGWTMIHGSGNMYQEGVAQPSLWNNIDKDSYVRRICSGCWAKSHQNVVYKRLTAKKDVDMKTLFLEWWRSYPSGGANNVLNQDFNLFTNIANARTNSNPWNYCDYNEGDVGFPRNCGPSGPIYWQWNGLNHAGTRQPNYAFYVYTGETPTYPGYVQLYGRGSMIPSDDYSNLWNNIGPGSYIRRVCRSCTKQYHDDIVYKRLTAKGTTDFDVLFLNNMITNPPDNSNVLGTDFNLYYNLVDAQNNVNAWVSCGNIATELSVNMTNVTCAPLLGESTVWVPSNRNNGETSFAFYLYVG